jgi:hypothetical protein
MAFITGFVFSPSSREFLPLATDENFSPRGNISKIIFSRPCPTSFWKCAAKNHPSQHGFSPANFGIPVMI